MSDAKDDKTNDQNRSERAPLTLKPRIAGNVSSGTVKQSFSHGRSKTVVVETKRRRVDAPPLAAAAAPRPARFGVNAGAPPPRAPQPRPPDPVARRAAPPPTGARSRPRSPGTPGRTNPRHRGPPG